jgi:hypothetical protein
MSIKQEQRSDSEHTGEPVAWTLDSLEQEIYANTRTFVSLNVMEWLLTRLNTTPQQSSTIVRKPLTDEQIEIAENQIWNTDQLDEVERQANKEFVRAIEAAHGIKE